MSLMQSMVGKVLVGAVVILTVLSMAFGALSWYRGDKIDSLSLEIEKQKKALAEFEKDKKAQDVADKQLNADKKAIIKERDEFKQRLEDALKNSVCANTELPDDAKRVLKELYNSQRP